MSITLSYYYSNGMGGYGSDGYSRGYSGGSSGGSSYGSSGGSSGGHSGGYSSGFSDGYSEVLEEVSNSPSSVVTSGSLAGSAENHAVILLQTLHSELQGTFQCESLAIYILLHCQDIQKIYIQHFEAPKPSSYLLECEPMLMNQKCESATLSVSYRSNIQMEWCL